jgi:hypothetical protein
VVQGQPGKIVHETPISKITRTKWTGGTALTAEPALYTQSLEFKLQSHEKEKQSPRWNEECGVGII